MYSYNGMPYCALASTLLLTALVQDDSNSNGGRSNSTSTAAANAAGPPSSSPSATSSTSSSSAVPGPLRPPPPPTPGMLKTLDARLDYMRDTYLGRPVPVSLAGSGNQAKAAVIWTVCGQRPGFNKYAGCAEYRNAMVLFVNISEEGCGAFNNQFLEGGRTITWFASPSKHENSNDVLRLVHHANGFPPRESEDSAAAGAAPTAAAAASAEFTLAPARVALACRFPGEPYLWCGELEFRSMAAGSRPLQLTFRLADHAQLAASSEFQRMVKGLEG